MRIRISKLLVPLAGVLAVQAAPAHAQAPGLSSAVAGWDALAESVRTLPDRMLAKLPPDQRQDGQIQQEVGRMALAALAVSALDALASDPDHPAFVPQIGQVLNVGQPNADTIYGVARIAPAGVYRLSGNRGSLRMFVVAQMPPSPGEPGFQPEGGVRTTHDFNALKIDKDGRFDVILSPERPKGYTGDWWKLEPSSSKLLLRKVSSDWAAERDPRLSIERVDKPVTRPRPPAELLEARLRQMPSAMSFIGVLFVDHVEKLRNEGYVNKIKVLDPMGALKGQFYYEGAYELGDDEALLVETPVPGKCLYRSLILTNHLYETTDWHNNHSSLNDAQAQPDADGVLRIVISAKDPGVANWLDTAGHPRGLLQGRWTNCDAQPMPRLQKVLLADLPGLLPADTRKVTPAERESIIRERRAALQQRPHW